MANLRANKITSTEVFETTGSVQFDGNSSTYLTASSSDFAMGTGDFTVEGWVYQSGGDTTNGGMFSTALSDSSGVGIVIARDNMWIGNNSAPYDIISSTFWNLNEWTHVALTRSGTSLRAFRNGILVGTVTSTRNIDRQNAAIGRRYYDNTSFILSGHISNFRILKGQALYTKNFTPPTRELTVIPNTVLLACQSTTNTAQEATGKTITVNGNAVANELTPGLLTDVVKSGGTSAITGSVEFSGAPAATVGTDYLNVSSTDFAFGTSDFSVEMWFNSGDVSAEGQRGLIQLSDTVGGLKTDYTSGFVIATGVDNAGSASVNDIYSQILGDNLGSNDDPLRNDTWHHVALTRQSGTARLFLNGVLLGSSSAAESISAEHLVIGGWYSTSYLHKGFISNLRIVRGTALYTSDFIPPTRELKNIPGTVLLCCKDSNDPTAEETGKTITGYGDLQRADGVELITNGSFAGDFTGWTNGNPSQFTYSTDSVGGDTSGKLKYVAADSNLRTFTQYVTCVTGQKYNLSFVASSNASNAMVIDIDGTNVVTIDNNSNANLARYNHVFTAGSTSVRIRVESAASNTSYFDNFSVTLVDGSNKGSNFTPQVGSDGSVEFAGPTKINSENYFYLPTGNTESRGRGRGVFGGGYTPSNLNSQDIQYVNITSSGNAIDFGELTTLDKTRGTSSCSSSTRGVWGGGYSAPLTENTNIINYVTIASTGNALDFGELFIQKERRSSLANSTRGIFGGGSTDPTGPSNTVNNIDYLTIASTGNALDFGDLTVQRGRLCATSSSTRGLFSLGTTDSTANTNTIDYITIASSGNAVDFGDMSYATSWPTALSSSIRGVFAGGAFGVNTIEYVTIASTGNSQDFGDATQGLFGSMGTSNGIKGLIAGNITSLEENRIEYITIATTGNGQDFGDLVKGITVGGACSDSHGGLG